MSPFGIATATEMSRQYREVYLGENAEQPSRILGSATWYTQGPEGYVDYPPLEEAAAA